MSKRLTAVIHLEDDMYVALCPELDVVSQGETLELAQDNLREAVELFFECASDEEVQRRLADEIFVTQFEDGSLHLGH
jgi:predicted RNase H-like HicB family nuclease